MLLLTGKCLGVQTENMNGPTGAFTKVSIHVLDGLDKFVATVGRDFPPTDLPREGEDVSLAVEVSAFARKAGGAGVQITATSKVKATGQRIAAAS